MPPIRFHTETQIIFVVNRGRYLVGFRPELEKHFKASVMLNKALVSFTVAHVKNKDGIDEGFIQKTIEKAKKIAEQLKDNIGNHLHHTL